MAASPQTRGHDRPSTWQLLFGKNKQHSSVAGTYVAKDKQDNNNNIDDDEDHYAEPTRKVEHTRAPEATGIADQLLNALDKRLRQREPEDASDDDGTGRECSERLLGKTNAFVPQMRVDHESGLASDTSGLDPSARRQAREILNSRLAVDRHADAIRMKKKDTQLRHQDAGIRPSRPLVSTATRSTAERLAKLRDIQQRRDDALRVEREQVQRERSQKAAATNRPKLQTTVRGPLPTQSRRGLSNGISSSSNVTSQQTSKSKTTTRNADNQTEVAAHSAKPRATPADNQTQPSPPQLTREFRRLEEKLRELRVANADSTALEAKVQQHTHVLRIKRRVWTIWRDRVDRRRRDEASVARGYQWKLMGRLWNAWRTYAVATRADRLAEEERQRRIQSKLREDLADRFYRRRQLPVWFHLWRSSASARREARVFEEDIQRRRDQAKRLMERLAHPQQQTQAEDTVESVTLKPLARPQPVHTATQKPAEKKVKSDATRLPDRDSSMIPSPPHSTSTSSGSPSPPPLPRPQPTQSVPPPDAFYLTMQERAVERKARRDQLKLKYEQQEQAKREALERQVAEREAVLEQQKLAEKERLREKKREEARLAREKEARHQVDLIKQQSAQLHDKLRVLFYYGFRPWQQQWLVSRRIVKNATKWHALRVCHRTWTAWLEYLDNRRELRQEAERKPWLVATQHHNRVVTAKALQCWRAAQEATRTKALAIQRQWEWSARRRVWTRWHHQYALTVSHHTHQEQHVSRQLARRRLSRMLVAWHQVAIESKKERARQTEKELMWKKARAWLDE